MMFQRFCQQKAYKTIATIEKFEESTVYSGFVSFARYTMRIGAIDPMGFLDFLLKANVAMHKWQQEKYYQRFILERSKVEDPLLAVERNFKLMQQWADENNEHWTDFFRKVEPPQAVMWIKSGRISPWVLFSVPESSNALLNRMSTEQLSLVSEFIDMKYWEIKLEKHSEEVETIKSMLLEAGV